jgi:hypothetical protein
MVKEEPFKVGELYTRKDKPSPTVECLLDGQKYSFFRTLYNGACFTFLNSRRAEYIKVGTINNG